MALKPSPTPAIDRRSWRVLSAAMTAARDARLDDLRDALAAVHRDPVILGFCWFYSRYLVSFVGDELLGLPSDAHKVGGLAAELTAPWAALNLGGQGDFVLALRYGILLADVPPPPNVLIATGGLLLRRLGADPEDLRPQLEELLALSPVSSGAVADWKSHRRGWFRPRYWL